MNKLRTIFISVLALTALTTAFDYTALPAWSLKAAAEVHSVTKEDGWIDLAEPEDYAYSFAVIGDPQYMTQYDNRNKTTYVKDMYKWIVDNVESKKIQHVIGVGDITHQDTEGEWKVANEAISQMNGVVPYSLVRGNHDNRTTFFDQIFGGDDAKYMQQQSLVSCYQPESSIRARNTAHEFLGDDVDYLVVTLDFGAQDDVLEWANSVVEAYPNHTVIVSTHAFLHQTGVILQQSHNSLSPGCDQYETKYASTVWGGNGKEWIYQAKTQVDQPFNNGTDLWDKFIKLHANISMVFCGHVLNCDMTRTQMYGDNGNLVEQIMINPQAMDDDGFSEAGSKAELGTDESFTGSVAIFYCSEDGKTIDVQWYSTVKEKFYRDQNQFQFKPATTERGAPYVKVLTFGGGSASPTYATLEGEKITIEFTPEKYYRLGSVKLNGVDITEQVQDNKYVIDETEGYYQIKATFVEETRYAFIEQNDMSKGRLTYSLDELDASFREGETFTVKITPVEGCSVKQVTLNGEVLKPDENGYYHIKIAAQDNVLAVEYNTPKTPETESEGGCSSVLSSLPAIIMALFALALYFIARRKRAAKK